MPAKNGLACPKNPLGHLASSDCEYRFLFSLGFGIKSLIAVYTLDRMPGKIRVKSKEDAIMPRGMKKQINYEEELKKIDMQITRWKNTILELQERKKVLIQEREAAELSALYQAVKASGKTVDELISALKGEGAA